MRREKGITLVALIITIIVLVILVGVSIGAMLNSGIIKNTETATTGYSKEEATEKMNLKITNIQMETYAQQQTMPTLQMLADSLCKDDEMQYVQLTSEKTASLAPIEVKEAKSIYTKLKAYPYEFEIDSSLRLASIDGVKIATNDDESSSSMSYDVIFEFDSNITSKCANVEGTYTLSLGTGKNSIDDYKCIIVISQGCYGETEVSNTIWNFPNEKITKKNYTDVKDKYYQYCNSAIVGNASYYVRYSFFDKSFEISDIGYVNRMGSKS